MFARLIDSVLPLWSASIRRATVELVYALTAHRADGAWDDGYARGRVWKALEYLNPWVARKLEKLDPPAKSKFAKPHCATPRDVYQAKVLELRLALLEQLAPLVQQRESELTAQTERALQRIHLLARQVSELEGGTLLETGSYSAPGV